MWWLNILCKIVKELINILFWNSLFVLLNEIYYNLRVYIFLFICLIIKLWVFGYRLKYRDRFVFIVVCFVVGGLYFLFFDRVMVKIFFLIFYFF